MNSSNEIQKAVHDSVEVIKDSVSQLVMQHVAAAGEKGVRREDLPKLIAVIKANIDQNYHNSSRNIDKVITKAFAKSNAAALEVPVKKK